MDPNIEKGRSQDTGLELMTNWSKWERGGQIGLVTFAQSNICPNDFSAK